MDVIERFLEPPKGSFFLFGPRGTGKSTWVRHCFPKAVIVDLLQPDKAREMHARPERLVELVEAGTGQRTVVVDEVQKVPELLSVIHSLIEKERSVRFVLTGSSSRKLKRAGVNLLAGRAVLSHLHPFMASELGGKFNLKAALERGLLPVVMGSKEPERALETYAGLYLRDEVQMEGMVRKVGDFARFLEIVTFSHAGVLSVSNMARECQVGRKSAEAYIEILEELLLAFRLPIFTRRAKRILSAHPKFFLSDAGLFRVLRPRGPFDQPAEIDGQALEGLVAQHLRAWIDYRAKKNTLYFWRTAAGTEVDFVVFGDDGLWGIEVKNSDRVRPEDLRGLKSFRDEYPGAKTVLLYRGKERLLIDRTSVLPCEDFLTALRPSTDLAAAVSGKSS